MKNRLAFIAITTSIIVNLAQAGDAPYFLQPTLNCTYLPSGQSSCDLDKTYFSMADTSQPIPAGTYHTQYQGAYAEYNSDTQSWTVLTLYMNANTNQSLSSNMAFGSIYPDLNAPGNLWVAQHSSKNGILYDCGKDSFSPANPPATPKQCPLTHTPFVNPLTTTNKLSTEYVAPGTNQIIINNNTNYAVVLHADDYNNSTITFTTVVPPNTLGFVAGTYENKNSQNFNLMFDTEIVQNSRTAENRSSDNTVVLTATITPSDETFKYDNYLLDLSPTGLVVTPEINPDTSFPIDANGNIQIDVKYGLIGKNPRKSKEITITQRLK